MNYYIITGTSRGIGEAIAKKLLVPGNVLLCISRTENEDLIESASNLNIPIYSFAVDLGKPGNLDSVARDVFKMIDPAKAGSVSLINNAGMAQPVAFSGNLGLKDMQSHLNLNLLAPAALSNLFIRMFANLEIPKVILNISSGAADFPYLGWSLYCSSKAGVDMMTKVIGMEQAQAAHPVKVFSLHPGIVETSMQEELRSLDDKDFPDKLKFIELYDRRLLLSPSEVADVIVHSLFNPNIPQGENLTLDQLKEYYSK